MVSSLNLIYPRFFIWIGAGVGISTQTRSLRSSGFTRSRSASELLLTQKTELPRLTTVCLGDPDTALLRNLGLLSIMQIF